MEKEKKLNKTKRDFYLTRSYMMTCKHEFIKTEINKTNIFYSSRIAALKSEEEKNHVEK